MTTDTTTAADRVPASGAGSTSPADAGAVRVPPFRRLVWLVPAAYALHVVEESVGDFPRWVTTSLHGSFSLTGFVVNNSIFMTLVLVLVTLNARRTSPRRATVLVVWTSANLFWDGLFHVVSTAALGVYSPGLVTAALLYVPLCLLLGTAVLTQRVLPVRRFVLAVFGGLAVFGFVLWYGLFHLAV